MNVNMRENYINDDQYKEWNCYILCSAYYSVGKECVELLPHLSKMF